MQRKEFEKKTKEIASFIKQEDNFVIVNHFDADGLTSGAIIIKTLEKQNKKYEIKTVKQLYHSVLEEIKKLGKKIIFVDFGSGQLDLLKENFTEFAVIDHHQPMNIEHSLHLNPIIYGFDGAGEISGAGLAYLVAKKTHKELENQGAIAIVGAIGDIQDIKGKLTGLNAETAIEAQKNGLIKIEKDLRLYGRISRPLAQFLSYSTTPIIPKITANEQNSYAFLKDLGIELKQNEKWRTYSQLTKKEKQILTSGLITHLMEHGMKENQAQHLIGEVYTLVKENPTSPLRDAKEYATLLNACGRHNKTFTGIQVCLGDRQEYYFQALALLQDHRSLLRNGIEWVKKNGIEDKENFYFFDAKNNIPESIVGIVAGMLYGSGIIESDKPIIAFADEDRGGVKVSGRATQELVKQGINLGKTFREIADELHEKSLGGGHNIAAGLMIQQNEKEKFIKKLQEKLSQNLKY